LGIEIFHSPKKSNEMKKGILINVEDQILTWVEVGEYTDIYTHLNCQYFECPLTIEGSTLYVDEEGLLNLTPFTKFFSIGNRVFSGNGLFLGTNLETGESDDCSLSLDFVKSKVKFMDIYEVQMKVKLGELV
jgi:hypothetical protein